MANKQNPGTHLVVLSGRDGKGLLWAHSKERSIRRVALNFCAPCFAFLVLKEGSAGFILSMETLFPSLVYI